MVKAEIHNCPEELASVVKEVKRAGGEPFLIPAMGNHGGATPEGHLRILKSLQSSIVLADV